MQPPVVWPGQPSAGGLGFEGFGVKGESFVVETWVGAKESGFEMFEHDTNFSKYMFSGFSWFEARNSRVGPTNIS